MRLLNEPPNNLSRHNLINEKRKYTIPVLLSHFWIDWNHAPSIGGHCCSPGKRLHWFLDTTRDSCDHRWNFQIHFIDKCTFSRHVFFKAFIHVCSPICPLLHGWYVRILLLLLFAFLPFGIVFVVCLIVAVEESRGQVFLRRYHHRSTPDAIGSARFVRGSLEP